MDKQRLRARVATSLGFLFIIIAISRPASRTVWFMIALVFFVVGIRRRRKSPDDPTAM